MSSGEDALAALTHRMAELGVRRPDSWATSEIKDGIPQQARYLVLRHIWARALAPLFGLGYPSAPLPFAFNAVSKVVAFVAALSLFLPQRGQPGTPEPTAAGLAVPKAQ